MKILCKTCNVISEGVEPIEAMGEGDPVGLAHNSRLGLFFQCPVCQSEWFVPISIVWDWGEFTDKYSFERLNCRDGQTMYSYKRKPMLVRSV